MFVAVNFVKFGISVMFVSFQVHTLCQKTFLGIFIICLRTKCHFPSCSASFVTSIKKNVKVYFVPPPYCYFGFTKVLP